MLIIRISLLFVSCETIGKKVDGRNIDRKGGKKRRTKVCMYDHLTGKRKLGAGTKSNYPTAYVNSSFGLYDVEGIKISYGFPLTCWI
jgi:hypothetical protein